jgi:hypothetical protein
MHDLYASVMETVIARRAAWGFHVRNPFTPMRALLLFLLLATSAFAQQTGGTGGTSNPASPTGSPTPTPTPPATPAPTRNLWTCSTPGGTYQVLVSAMLSVSQQEYIVDGAARVTEVNIDTQGQFAVRFYYIEPAVVAGPGGIGAATFGKVQDVLSQAADRSGSDVWKKVVKSYPTTTHARTIEYRVGSKDSLTKIFTSAAGAQGTGKPDTVTISD